MNSEHASTTGLNVGADPGECYEMPEYCPSSPPAEAPAARYSTAPEVTEPGMRRRIVGDISPSSSSSPTRSEQSKHVPLDRRLSHSVRIPPPAPIRIPLTVAAAVPAPFVRA